MKWIKASERLPEVDGLYLVIHKPPSGQFRHEMFFKMDDKKWYWLPNPYSVCGDGFIIEWLDESGSEPEGKEAVEFAEFLKPFEYSAESDNYYINNNAHGIKPGYYKLEQLYKIWKAEAK